MKTQYRFIAEVNCNTIQVASTQASGWVSDTQCSHFSFAIFGQDPEEVLKAIESVIEERNDHDKYHKEQELVLGYGTDKLRIVRQQAQVSISRGNLKILYYGSVDRLYGLPAVLRKAIDKYNKRCEKELEKDIQEYLKHLFLTKKSG